MENNKKLQIDCEDIRYAAGLLFVGLSAYLLWSRRELFGSLINDLGAGNNLYRTILSLIYFFTYLLIGAGLLFKVPIFSSLGIIGIIFYVLHVMSLFQMRYNAVTITVSVGVLLIALYLTISAKEEEYSSIDNILDQVSDLRVAYENHEIDAEDYFSAKDKIYKILF